MGYLVGMMFIILCGFPVCAVAERFGRIKDAKLEKNKYRTVFELSCGTQ